MSFKRGASASDIFKQILSEERTEVFLRLKETKPINHPAAKPSWYDQIKDCLIFMFHPRGKPMGIHRKSNKLKFDG